MAKKTKLNVEPFDDIKIIGINTGIPDYQLAWHINKVLKLNLVKYKNINNNDDIPDELATPDDLYSFYLYDVGENANAFNLVALNSYEGKPWVLFKPKTDFLFIIRNFIKDNDFSQILKNIKSIPNVIHAYTIDLDYNKKIDALLERIELHEMEIVKEMSNND